MIRFVCLTTKKSLISTTNLIVTKTDTLTTTHKIKSFVNVNPFINLTLVRNLQVNFTDFIVAKHKKKDKSSEYNKKFKRSKSTIKKYNKNSKFIDSKNMNTENAISNGNNNHSSRKYNRPWLEIKNTKNCSSAGISSKGLELTVMSYNVLAQHLADIHRELYSNHHTEHLKWSNRFRRLMENINEVNPTILCLQEVQESHLKQYQDELKKKKLKRFIYKKRSSDEYQDGCAIFYNADMFVVIEQHCIEYFRPNVTVLDRPNVAIIVKFQSINDPNIIFIVATTHLLYNPKREDVRLAQIQVLLAEIDRISFLSKNSKTGELVYAPIILTGDFNLQPHSGPYRLLTKGSLKYDELTSKRLEQPLSKCDMDKLMGKMILPVSLGITDNCQHFQSVCQKKDDDFNTKVFSNDVCNTDKQLINEYTETQIINSGLHFQTGTLSHKLNFRSIYDQSIENDKRITATTFQNEWITVDYMFYSLKYNLKKNKYEEEFIKLMEKHELPTINDLIRTIQMIPNEFFGSDHFSLAAKFIILPIMNE